MIRRLENRALNVRYLLKDWKGASADFDKIISSGRSDTDLFQKSGTAKFNMQDFKGCAELLGMGSRAKRVKTGRRVPDARIKSG